MSDIVERLRAVERDMGADSWPHGAAVVRKAAAEIERLRTALQEVRHVIGDCDALTSGELAGCIADVLDGLGDAP